MSVLESTRNHVQPRKETQLDRMKLIILNHQVTNAKEAVKVYKMQYGGDVHDTTYYKALKQVRAEERQAAAEFADREGPASHYRAVEQAKADEETAAGPAGDPPPTLPAPSIPFVSDELMENIEPIQDACLQAGGIENAELVAAAIERCGGVANFLKACKLLNKMKPPTSPLANYSPNTGTSRLPADINSRL